MAVPAETLAFQIAPGQDSNIFAEPFIRGSFPARALFGSVLGHAAFFLLLPQLSTWSLFNKEPSLRLYVATVHSLTVELHEPLYAPAPRRQPAPPRQESTPHPAAAEAPPRANVLTEPADLPAPPSPPKRAVVLARRFELPPIANPKRDMPQVILQPPDASVGVPIQALPKVLAWN